MTIALLYAFLSGFALILGTIIGTSLKIPQKVLAAIMAFGSGVMICALTFGLMEEAFKHGGFDAVIIGFLVGGVVFIFGDFLIHRAGGRSFKRKKTLFKVNPGDKWECNCPWCPAGRNTGVSCSRHFSYQQERHRTFNGSSNFPIQLSGKHFFN